MKRKLSTVRAGSAFSPVSLAVRAGGFVYTCGQMPTDPHTGEPVEDTIEDKARATLETSTGARVRRRSLLML